MLCFLKLCIQILLPFIGKSKKGLIVNRVSLKYNRSIKTLLKIKCSTLALCLRRWTLRVRPSPPWPAHPLKSHLLEFFTLFSFIGSITTMPVFVSSLYIYIIILMAHSHRTLFSCETIRKSMSMQKNVNIPLHKIVQSGCFYHWPELWSSTTMLIVFISALIY